MELVAKALVGAVMVVIIQLLAGTRHYHVAGLAPLFPCLALMAHYIVGTERGAQDVRNTALFGMWSVLPYLGYLASMYVLVPRLRLGTAMVAATFVWLLLAGVLVVIWQRPTAG